jgi:acyl-CoA dehydrogenase
MLSGRLADIHANLFISTAILKYYEHGKKTEAEQIHAKLALEKSLFNAQEAFYGLFANFPVSIAAGLVKFICFPLGRPVNKPSDALKQQVGEIIMQDNAFRDELKKHVFYNTAEDDVTGRMESTFNMLLELEPLWDKFKKAESKGQFKGLTFDERINDAVEIGFITQQEASSLLTYNAKRYDSMLTDVFDSELDQTLELENPYNDEEESAPMPDPKQQEPLSP